MSGSSLKGITSIGSDAQAVLEQLPSWLDHYNRVHPHRALGYRSPREFIDRSTRERPSGLQGATTLGKCVLKGQARVAKTMLADH